MTAEQGITIRDLSFAYRGKTALDRVSLSLTSGHFTALLGPNGAGKSTLIALLTRLMVAERGEIRIFGDDIARRPSQALAKMGIVFQSQTLDLDLTVRQNMCYFAALRGLAGRRARRRMEESLSRMGLADRQNEKARTLNSGHRRRLEIARALVHEPELLVLDEPTVGLDVSSRQDLVQHVHELCASQGLTVLWATHLVDEINKNDDLVILHKGRIRAAGSVPDVLAATQSTTVLEAFTRLTSRGSALDNDTE